MELTSEDRQRIEQEAHEYGRKMSDDPLHPNELAIFYFKPGAEYATIYERQKLDGDSLAKHQIDYYENQLESMRRMADMQFKDWEAEGTDLLAKVAEQEKKINDLQLALNIALNPGKPKDKELASLRSELAKEMNRFDILERSNEKLKAEWQELVEGLKKIIGSANSTQRYALENDIELYGVQDLKSIAQALLSPPKSLKINP